MKKLTLILLIFFGLYSCEKTINVKLPDEGRKIVIYGFYTANKKISVSLSKSQYILDPKTEIDWISDASLSLFENGNLIETVDTGANGNYFFESLAKPGKKYKIEANYPNFPIASGESQVPYVPVIDNSGLTVRYQTYGERKSIEQINFKLTFKDNGQEKNYYMLQALFKQRSRYTNLTTGETGYHEYLYPANIYTNSKFNFMESVSDENYSGAIVIDDAVFNGKIHTLNFYTDYLYFNFTDNPDKIVKIYFYLSEVSEELYKYNLSYEKYLNTNGNPFAEPVQVFSNIKNGLGIFAGSALAVDSTSFVFGE